LVSLVVVTCAAWAVTLYQALNMRAPMEGMSDMAMHDMSNADWSLVGAGVFVALWTVMMAAMMLPAAAPMIMIFASAPAQRDRHRPVRTWIFVSGYILVWMAAGAAIYVLIQIAREVPSLFAAADQANGRSVALGFTLIAAGLYQFTPLKRICLRHCRSPLAFVAQHWRDGEFGALAMGLKHGAYCLGCCWVLFAVLVAAGIMSVAWMLLLTLLVFVEKLFPRGESISSAIGVAFVGLGLLVANGTISMQWS
jgi:predicted metal-binding membrane protein